MIPLLIGIFLFILFIVVVVLSASSWRGWHIAAACLTFLAALGLVVVASMSQLTHITWKDKHDDLKNRLLTERKAGIELEIGDTTVVTVDEPSLVNVQQKLSNLMLDRGRVWRRCMAPSPPANNQITLVTVPPNPDGTPGDPSVAAENGINQNMVLYGFREGELTLPDGQQMFVPIAYLGEYQVVVAQPSSVTLTPTLQLDPQQASLVNDTSASWALYEMMPLDAHRIFATQDTTGQKLDDTLEQPVFGEMNEQALRLTFAGVTGLNADDPAITQLVANYLKDGYAASDQDVSVFFANIWRKIEFQKAHSEQVDSNNLDPGISGNFFDPGGFAESTRLRSGDKVTFRVNDIGVFPDAAAEQLTESRICREIGPIYVRSLRDYEEAFHDTQGRYVKRSEDIRRVNRDIASLTTATEKAQDQITYRQEEREKLKSDQTGFNRDIEKMGALVAQLEGQKASLSKELSELYRTNLALSQQLATYSRQVTEAINRRAENIAVQ